MANRKNKNFYNEKVGAVAELQTIIKNKHQNDPTNKDIHEVAKKYKISYQTLKNAWQTFIETGTTVSRRETAGLKGKKLNIKAAVYPSVTKSNPTFTDACKMLLDWITDRKITTTQLCAKHGVSAANFYSWMREIENHGTLFGRSIVQPQNYAKYNVPDAIWYYKKGLKIERKSIINLTYVEQRALENFGQVIHNQLVQYLVSPTTTK